MMSNMSKTLLCVAVAGIFFITAVIYNIKFLFLIATFFDWLPLPTGWMKMGGSDQRIRRAGVFHGIVTLIAYFIGVLWLTLNRIGPLYLGYLFLELWFIAVIAGAYVTSLKAEHCI